MAHTVAIMQPYFMPYAGYFRLMAASDLFVFYDCVQFPRRGWVHRNKLTHINGKMEWLTLPLVKSERDTTRILDLCFAANAQEEWEMRMTEFPSLSNNASSVLKTTRILSEDPCSYIIKGLKEICAILDIRCEFARSSELSLPISLKGQDRILAIAQHYRADIYLNAPGGRELYKEEDFKKKGIELKFLPDYTNGYNSILERLMLETPQGIRQEIINNIISV